MAYDELDPRKSSLDPNVEDNYNQAKPADRGVCFFWGGAARVGSGRADGGILRKLGLPGGGSGGRRSHIYVGVTNPIVTVNLSGAGIAQVTGKDAANCRQILHRARAHVAEGRPRFEAHAPQHDALVAQFAAAVRSGDLAGLQATLGDDVSFVSDGGGKAAAARVPIVGAEAVAKFLAGLARLAPSTGMSVEFARVNAQAGLVVREHGRPVSVFSFQITGGRIAAIHVARNPDKLAHLP